MGLLCGLNASDGAARTGSTWIVQSGDKLRRKKLANHLLHETCLRYQAEVIAVEIMPDHVHLLVEVDPQFGIHRLVKKLKGVTPHNLRKEFPVLKSRLPTLWTNSYFVSTVGGAPLAVIKQYVENQ
ncbi:MAG: IS200/IS605 family transposase [Candidatus Sulfotelmatobacter sp.]